MGATRTWMSLSAGAVATLVLAACHGERAAGVSAAAEAPEAAAGAALTPVVATAPAGADPAVPTDPAQASVAGELALQRGDCRGAADDFAVASAGASRPDRQPRH